MSDDDWVYAVDSSPLVSVVPIGTVCTRAAVAIEFIALERRALGGVLTFVVADGASREFDQGPLIQSIPAVRLLADDGTGFETRLVGGDFLELSLIRYRAVFRPPLPEGVGAEVLIDRFEFGPLTSVAGPWSSGNIGQG